MEAISNLRGFVSHTEFHGTDLRGYAARDAALTLLANWEDALADGNADPLLQDIDLVVAYLNDFRARAMLALPLESGGLQGVPAEVWRDLLDDAGVSVYEAEDLPGHFGFTGCDADDFPSEEAAIVRAVLNHLDSDVITDAIAKADRSQVFLSSPASPGM